MNSLVFFAVLVSALFQASWNFFAKKSTANKATLLFIGWLLFGLITVPITAMFTDFSQFSGQSIKYICLSGAIHCLYVFLLGRAYTLGDISVVYPVSRGLGITLTTLITSFLAIDDITRLGAIGIFSVVGGTFLIASKELKCQVQSKGFKAAIWVAFAVSAYSISDSQGVYHVPPLFFIAIMNLATALFAIPLLLTKLKAPALQVLRHHKREGLLVAAGGSVAYVIILWAFKQSETSYIVAMREFSVVIASLLGVLFLKEKLYKRKIVALALIVAGIFLIKIT